MSLNVSESVHTMATNKMAVCMHFIYFIVCVKCVIGITFVVDDSASMNSLRGGYNGIINSLFKHNAEDSEFVLVTFSGSEVALRKKTSNLTEIRQALQNVAPNPLLIGSDVYCPENALSGIELALTESKPGSTLYVVTDGTAEDFNKLDDITQLCKQKQTKVVFALWGDCQEPHSSPKYTVQREIEKLCPGEGVKLVKRSIASKPKSRKRLAGN